MKNGCWLVWGAGRLGGWVVVGWGGGWCCLVAGCWGGRVWRGWLGRSVGCWGGLGWVLVGRRPLGAAEVGGL